MDKNNHTPGCTRASLLAIVFIGLVLGITACASMFNGSSSAEFPFDLMMQVDDLPSGWFNNGGSFPDEPGADSRLSAFAKSEDSQFGYRHVIHELSVYSSEELAKKAYPAWETEWFPTNTWKRPAEARFAPKDPNDQVRFACVPVSVNLADVLSCRHLQRHKQIISLILAEIDGKALTLVQLEEALERLDERMQRY